MKRHGKREEMKGHNETGTKIQASHPENETKFMKGKLKVGKAMYEEQNRMWESNERVGEGWEG